MLGQLSCNYRYPGLFTVVLATPAGVATGVAPSRGSSAQRKRSAEDRSVGARG